MAIDLLNLEDLYNNERFADLQKAQPHGAGPYVKKPVTIEKIGIAIKEELKNDYST